MKATRILFISGLALLFAVFVVGIYLSNVSEQNVFVGNAFIRNTDQVWQPPFESDQGRKGPNAFSEQGRGNYWSDYTGTDHNHDGIGDTPYHETDVFGYLLDRHPEARVFALSPALALLRKGEELMPLLDTTGVTDLAPLMRPVAAGVPPAVEGGILPPGMTSRIFKALTILPAATLFRALSPPGETPDSTSGGTPDATERGQCADARPSDGGKRSCLLVFDPNH